YTGVVLYVISGVIDDFIKLFMKRNIGLTSSERFLAHVVIGIIFYLVVIFNGFNNELNLPIIGNLPLGYLYGLFAVFWLVGFSNEIGRASCSESVVFPDVS